MFLFRITKLQNYKQKIEQEKMFAMEDPAPLQLTEVFEDDACVVYNQPKVSSPKKFRFKSDAGTHINDGANATLFIVGHFL